MRPPLSFQMDTAITINRYNESLQFAHLKSIQSHQSSVQRYGDRQTVSTWISKTPSRHDRNAVTPLILCLLLCSVLHTAARMKKAYLIGKLIAPN